MKNLLVPDTGEKSGIVLHKRSPFLMIRLSGNPVNRLVTLKTAGRILKRLLLKQRGVKLPSRQVLELRGA